MPATPGATYCSRCGRSLAPVGLPPPPASPYAIPSGAPTPVPPAGGYPTPGYGWPAAPPPAWQPGATGLSAQGDGPALQDTFLAGLVLMIGFAIGFIGPVVFGASLVPATSTTGVSISSTALTETAALSVVSAAFVAVGLALFHRAFRSLRDPEFRTPATLSLLGVISLLLLVVVDLALLETLAQLLTCLGGTSTTANSTATLNCIDSGAFILELLGVLAFGIMTIIGYIGSAVGIYRLGRRHGETMLEVAGVLICLPYLNFIGAILVLAGSRRARDRLAGSGPMPFGGLP